MYINTHSYFSLRYGTIRPEDLLHLAQDHRIDTLALTDINNTSASLDFVRLDTKYKIQPVLGVDFRNGAEQQFIILARSNQGYQKINTYLSEFLHQDKIIIPEKAKKLQDTFVIYPFHSHHPITLESHEYLGVKASEINQLRFSDWNKKRVKLVALQTVSFLRKTPDEEKRGKKYSRTYVHTVCLGLLTTIHC
jgi:DNA polymerase III alpha subunit